VNLAPTKKILSSNLYVCEVDFSWLSDQRRRKLVAGMDVTSKELLIFAYYFEHFRYQVSENPSYLLSIMPGVKIPILYRYDFTQGEVLCRDFLYGCAKWLAKSPDEILNDLFKFSKDREGNHPIPPLGLFDLSFLRQMEDVIHRVSTVFRPLLSEDLLFINKDIQELVMGGKTKHSDEIDERYFIGDEKHIHRMDDNLDSIRNYLDHCKKGQTIGFIPLDLKLPFSQNLEVFRLIWTKLVKDMYEYDSNAAHELARLRPKNRGFGKDSNLLKLLAQLGIVRTTHNLNRVWNRRRLEKNHIRFVWKSKNQEIKSFPDFLYENSKFFSKDFVESNCQSNEYWKKNVGRNIEKSKLLHSLRKRIFEMFPSGQAVVALRNWNQKTNETSDLTIEEIKAIDGKTRVLNPPWCFNRFD